MIFYLTHGRVGSNEYHVHKSTKCFFHVRDKKHEEYQETIQGVEACVDRIKVIASNANGYKVIIYDGLKRIEIKR